MAPSLKYLRSPRNGLAPEANTVQLSPPAAHRPQPHLNSSRQDSLIRRCQAKSCAAPVDPNKASNYHSNTPPDSSLHSLRIIFGIALFHLANHPFLGNLSVSLHLGSNPPGPFSEPGARSRLVPPVPLEPTAVPKAERQKRSVFQRILRPPKSS